MEFFKHFTDADSGLTLPKIKRKLGMAGLGRFWSLTEACAKRLKISQTGEYSESDCVFIFDSFTMMQILGTRIQHLDKTLKDLAEAADIKFKKDGDSITIRMPNLLKFIHRDNKRSRIPKLPATTSEKPQIPGARSPRRPKSEWQISMESAEKLICGLQLYNNSSSEEEVKRAQEFIGPELLKIGKKVPGGFASIRALKNEPASIKMLANQIKMAMKFMEARA